MGIVYIIKSSFTKASVVMLTHCRSPDQSCLAAKVISIPTACSGEKDFLSQLGWLRPTPKKPKAKQKRWCKTIDTFFAVSVLGIKDRESWDGHVDV